MKALQKLLCMIVSAVFLFVSCAQAPVKNTPRISEPLRKDEVSIPAKGQGSGDQNYIACRDRYNNCVDKYNECYDRLQAANEALKGDNETWDRYRKEMNKKKWAYFGYGVLGGAGLAAILTVIVLFVPRK